MTRISRRSFTWIAFALLLSRWASDSKSITGYRLTVEQWQAEVDDMIAKGAKISDSEFETIVRYLAKHFGRNPP
jgi:hypothetical protein